MLGRRTDNAAPVACPIVRIGRVFDVSVTTAARDVAPCAGARALRDGRGPPGQLETAADATPRVPRPSVVRAVHLRPHTWAADRRLQAVTHSTDGPFCRFRKTRR